MSLAAKASAFWQMKPVQMGAKSLAAGTVVAVSLLAFQKASKKIFGTTDDEAKQVLVKEIPEQERAITLMYELDPDLVEHAARLCVFRRFDRAVFDKMFVSLSIAVTHRHDLYELGLTATSAFQIRKNFQSVIEDTRHFRAILERQMPSAIEDFDDVAVEFNARLEQMCTDAIQDSLL
jgi:hypothetical protein